MTITLTINGRALQVSDGASVLDAINSSGTYVPQLCKDPDMKPIGACRTCLVQVEGMRGFPASCSVPVTEGMEVWTDTPQVRSIRRGVLELTQAMVGGNGNGTGTHRRARWAGPAAVSRRSEARTTSRDVATSAACPTLSPGTRP